MRTSLTITGAQLAVELCEDGGDVLSDTIAWIEHASAFHFAPEALYVLRHDGPATRSLAGLARDPGVAVRLMSDEDLADAERRARDHGADDRTLVYARYRGQLDRAIESALG